MSETNQAEARAGLAAAIDRAINRDPVDAMLRARAIRDDLEKLILEKYGLEDTIVVATALAAALAFYFARAWTGQQDGAVDYIKATVLEHLERELRLQFKTDDNRDKEKRAIERGADRHGG